MILDFSKLLAKTLNKSNLERFGNFKTSKAWKDVNNF